MRDHFVNARFGRTARERFRAAASPDLRGTLTTTGNPWVDFAQFVEASELVCTMFGDGTHALALEIGRFGAETNMGTWRAIAHRMLSPRTLLGIAAGLWGHHYDGGRLVVEAEGEAGVRVRITDFPQPHRTHCLAIEGWIGRTIELGRPRSVRVRQTSCRLDGGGACELVAVWE
ncbi:MAG: hypothetical protein R3B70_34390 [Polyangiaceae bacterium]